MAQREARQHREILEHQRRHQSDLQVVRRTGRARYSRRDLVIMVVRHDLVRGLQRPLRRGRVQRFRDVILSFLGLGDPNQMSWGLMIGSARQYLLSCWWAVAFPGAAMVISHDRWFLDRIATHILAYEDDGGVVFHEGNFSDYEEDHKKRLGAAAEQPHRVAYRKLK